MAMRRVNSHDIAAAGSIGKLISNLVDMVRAGNMETKEYGVGLLRSLTDQPPQPEGVIEKKRPNANAVDSPMPMSVPVEHIGVADHSIMIAHAGGIKPLVSLCVIGSPIAQRDACAALANIARKSAEYQEVIIKANGIVAMSNLLRTGDAAAQEQAAAALASVSQSPSSRAQIVGLSGAVASLVNLCKGNQRHDAQIFAASTLANLATGSVDGQTAVAKAGAIPRLIELLAGGKALEACACALGKLAHANLQNQTEICRLGGIPRLLPALSAANVEAQVQAAAALAEIAGGERIKRRQDAIAKAGGIRPLLALVESRHSQAQCMALHALAELCINNKANQDTIATLEGVQPLVSLISVGGASADVQSYAARSLAQLVKHHEKNQTSVADLGAVSMLVSLMQRTQTGTSEALAAQLQAEVAGALYALGEGNPANQNSIVSAGAISVLVLQLGSRSDHAAKLAGNALSSLGLDNPTSQAEIAKGLVHMLTTAKRESTQERAAAALWRLVRANPANRHGIALAGGAQNLVRLLRDGTHGAQAFALWALSLCINNENRNIIIETGAIGPLVDKLTSDDASIAEQAAGALAMLTFAEPSDAKTLKEIAKHGAVSPLIALLDQTVSVEARMHAAGALSKLALVPSQRQVIERAGGISPLVTVLNDPFANGTCKKFAAAALGLLSTEEEESTSVTTEAQQHPVQQKQQRPGETSAPPSPLPGSSDPSPASERASTSTSPEKTRPSISDRAEEEQQHAQQHVTPKATRSPRKKLIASEGAIAPLVQLLRKSDDEQEEAAGALRALANNQSIRMAITDSGGIGPLVVMLGGKNPRARDNAEGALVRLSMEMVNRVIIIQQLVSMLQDPEIRAREQAAAAVANLARESTANCTSIVDAGGIAPLLELLSTDSSKAKENAASAISELANGSRPTQNAIAREGGIPRLIEVLNGSSSNKNDNSQGQLETILLHAIWRMAKKNFANQVALVEAGAITPLVNFLGNASPEVQLPATGVVECLLQCRDIHAAVVRTGAIAPLCTLSRDGDIDTQEQAAAALWSLSTDNAPNKTTIAKLGGIESLVKMVEKDGSEKSQKNAAGALASLASKHAENRTSISKRIVALLSDRGVYGKSDPKVAARAMSAITRMCGRKMVDDETQLTEISMDCRDNQNAIAKAGGVPAIINWLGHDDEEVQTETSHALLAMATSNQSTQMMISKADGGGLPGLIRLIQSGCVEAQEHSALALWHLADMQENIQAIADADGIKALVSMLGIRGEGERGGELAAVTMVRLAQGSPEVSTRVAEWGGIAPLVGMLKASGTSNASATQQAAAAALAELSLEEENRDKIATAGGIEPLIRLLGSPNLGTPETAARALAHLARNGDDEGEDAKAAAPEDSDDETVGHATERRAHIKRMGGVTKLIKMLEVTNAPSAEPMTTHTFASGVPASDDPKLAMMEQAAAALEELSNGDLDMQDAIIDADGVRKLLALVVNGSPLAQENAAGTLRHLSTSEDNQIRLVESGCIPELIALVKHGSPRAQEAACGALSNLARGSVQLSVAHDENQGSEDDDTSSEGEGSFARRLPSQLEEPGRRSNRSSRESGEQATVEVAVVINVVPNRLGGVPRAVVGFELPEPDSEEEEEERATDGLNAIADAHGIPPIVALLGNKGATPKARELAAAALFHLAGDRVSRDLIANAGGIFPLVGLLDGGTRQAHRHASDALARLSNENREHQSQIAKRLVSLLMASNSNSSTVQQRAAHALQMLAKNNAGSPAVIVKAGAISPLVHLLSTSLDADVKKEAADTLETLVTNSDDNLAAVTDLVVLLGTGSPKAQELVLQLLFTIAKDAANQRAIAQTGALQKLVLQLDSLYSKVQELAAATLSHLVCNSSENVEAVASHGGIPRLIKLLHSHSTSSHLHSHNTEARSHAAAVLADMSRQNAQSHAAILAAGGIYPLIKLLMDGGDADAKAEAAGALGFLAQNDTEAQTAVVQAGAIEPLVALLRESSRRSLRKAATAIRSIVAGRREHQDEVAEFGGVALLVDCLKDARREEVQAVAASTIADLAAGNPHIQRLIATANGIPQLVMLVEDASTDKALEAAITTLRSVAADNALARIGVAAAGGILALISKLELIDEKLQIHAAEALTNIALGNEDNEATVSTLLVKLLHQESTAIYAARAIAKVAMGGTSIRDALNDAGVIDLLASLLRKRISFDVPGAKEPKGDKLQMELCAAMRSLATDHPRSQSAIASSKGIPSLVAHLPAARPSSTPLAQRYAAASVAAPKITTPAPKVVTPSVVTPASSQRRISTTPASPQRPASLSRQSTAGTPASAGSSGGLAMMTDEMKAKLELQCNAAGALWKLAADASNRQLIAEHGGVQPLVYLLESIHPEAQAAAAGALRCLAAEAEIRRQISAAGAIASLALLVVHGSAAAKEQAGGCLSMLVIDNQENQETIAKELVQIFAMGVPSDMEQATLVTRELALHYQGSVALDQAGATPHLIKQIAEGTDQGCECSARALSRIAAVSTESRSTITHQLISVRHEAGSDVRVAMRAARALSEMDIGDDEEGQQAVGLAILMFRMHTRE